ncbi:hypothetical protein DENSPDRAFT_182866 [Dentipellis sp. KUC8613]|nr:hypothetical protein DENSPDRAFT_182866 [Dentipellis sp. KUC8613]
MSPDIYIGPLFLPFACPSQGPLTQAVNAVPARAIRVTIDNTQSDHPNAPGPYDLDSACDSSQGHKLRPLSRVPLLVASIKIFQACPSNAMYLFHDLWNQHMIVRGVCLQVA